MKTNLARTVFFSFAVLILAASFTLAQNSPKTEKHQMKSGNMKMDMKGMKMDSSMHSGKSATDKNNKKEMSSAIKAYEGVIDLKAIDVNKDGKVYECPMDFNVLSDKPGVDPKCGMKLEEVSLKQAKENLIKHGFKVK